MDRVDSFLGFLRRISPRYQISHPEISDGAKAALLVCDATSLPGGTHDNMAFGGMHASDSTIKDLPAIILSQLHMSENHSLILACAQVSVDIITFTINVTQITHGYIMMLQNFNQISSLAPENPKGNVHSGASPPWFEANEENQLLNDQINTGLCMDGLVSPLDKSGKSRKLNPKRVGTAWAEKRKIELEMENRGEITNNCDADWLPNFGRVWQSGTRKESTEFETEKQKLLMVDGLLETPIKIQPYMSKRMRRDVSESDGVIGSHLEATKNVA
ncbi:hypothetical protein HHK36_007577 [Tetracentron sinense]|uniref:Uncharacterized protein n=1 Tax=Tetracentron sinense TaxID=13715 RepID=A0A834ZJ61_TETSI|nr:hypothetical protein HHK36_007577 [Tetracentron sinense]